MIYVIIDGIDGNLPNLDLINTITKICNYRGYSVSIGGLWQSSLSYDQSASGYISYYLDNFRHLVQRILRHTLFGSFMRGEPIRAQSIALKYHINALTLSGQINSQWKTESYRRFGSYMY